MLFEFKYDDTDDRNARANAEYERKYVENVELETNRQRKLIDSLTEFKIKDDIIKEKRKSDKIDTKVRNSHHTPFL